MIRKDLYKIDIQENLYLLVFHKVHNGGFGPAVSLYINNFEFLKFDCFGETKGHYHIYDRVKNDTIYFTEQTSKEQINRTANELINNIQFYLQKSCDVNIKNFNVDMDSLTKQIGHVKNKMIEYEDKYYFELR